MLHDGPVAIKLHEPSTHPFTHTDTWTSVSGKVSLARCTNLPARMLHSITHTETRGPTQKPSHRCILVSEYGESVVGSVSRIPLVYGVQREGSIMAFVLSASGCQAGSGSNRGNRPFPPPSETLPAYSFNLFLLQVPVCIRRGTSSQPSVR